MMNTHIQNLVKVSGTSWKYNDDGTKNSIVCPKSWGKIVDDQNPKSDKFMIRTGEKFGIIVVDVDIKHGKNGQDILMEYDIDMDEYPTLTFRTPSGGLHYFYNWKQGLVDANYLPNIDMIDHKANGWFVFHDIKRYICEKDIPIADMPEELYDLFIAGHTKYVAEQLEAKKDKKMPKQQPLSASKKKANVESKKKAPLISTVEEANSEDTFEADQLQIYYDLYMKRYNHFMEYDESGSIFMSKEGEDSIKKLNDNFVSKTGISVETAMEFVNKKRLSLATAKKQAKVEASISTVEVKSDESTTEPTIDDKHYNLLRLLDDDWFQSYDKWAGPAYALYNLKETENTIAFNTYIKLLKEKSGGKYDYDGARTLWITSIPDAQDKMRKDGDSLITMAKFKKIIGGAKNALYAEWKNKYEPKAVKETRKTVSDLKQAAEDQYEQLLSELSDAINAHGRCMIYDENDVSFSDICRLHTKTINIDALALLVNRSFVCLLQRGGLYLVIKEVIVARCKFTKKYKKNTTFDKFDFDKNFSSKIMVNIILEDATIIKVALKKVIFDISCKIPNYDNIGFFPTGPHDTSETPESIFNIFAGFLHKYDKEYVPKQSVIDTFCSLYKTILCDSNERSYNFEINKLAHIIQHPEIKTEAVSIFEGEQGTGKSFLMMFLMMYVFGKNLSLVIFQPEQLTNKFNSHLMGKLFIVLEEAVDLGNLKDISKFKGYVRAPVLNVEFKNMNVSESVECCMNFMIATNNDYNSMFREAGERTANLNKVSGKYYRNTVFFKEMSDILNNYEAGKDIFHYLANIDLTGFNIKEVPETDTKFNKKLESTNTFFKFLYHTYNNDIDDDERIDDGDDHWIRTNDSIDLERELTGNDLGYMKIMTIYRAYIDMCEHEFGLPKGAKGVFSKDAIKPFCEEYLQPIEPKAGRREYLMTKRSVGDALNSKFKTTQFTAK